MNRVCMRMVMSSSRLSASQTECQSLSGLQFSSLSVNMKGLVPTVTSNMVTALHSRPASPAARPPLHIKPPADNSGPRCLNEIRRCSHPPVKGVTFSVFQLSRVNAPNLRVRTRSRRSRRTSAGRRLSRSRIKALLVPWVNSQACVHTHTHINTPAIQRGTRFREVQLPASSWLLLLCLLSCGRSAMKIVL